MEAIIKSGHEGKIEIGLDVASSEFYVDGKYDLSIKTGEKNRIYPYNEMVELYQELIERYPIVSIEDPFDQDDFPAYVSM